MYQRDASLGCPTSTTAALFRQSWRRGRVTGASLDVVSLASGWNRLPSRCGWLMTCPREHLRAVAREIGRWSRLCAHEHPMVPPSERTGPLQRPGASPVGPERLLRSAIRLQSANREDVAHPCDHDVAFAHAPICPWAPELVVVAQPIISKLAISMNSPAWRQLFDIPDEITFLADVALLPAPLVGEQRPHRVALRALRRHGASSVYDLAAGRASRPRGSTGS